MNKLLQIQVPPRVVLDAETAADLMTANPISIRSHATVREAVALLIDRGISAAPVIDDAGLPVGVISQSDILVHNRERVEHVPARAEFFHRSDLSTASGEVLPRGFQVEKVDRTRVHELMTPMVFSVPLKAPAWRVVQEMLALKVHRLFVVDDQGVLVGVISALDILRKLRPEEP
ncbi:MAG: CBS domain-containing protein [Gemmataceae bacterium]|nr:CBS domain-containing protein [Gemmataceae bacterium]MDW8266135.1 CBS domain-containing protein [Gemmataceae bacterium]